MTAWRWIGGGAGRDADGGRVFAPGLVHANRELVADHRHVVRGHVPAQIPRASACCARTKTGGRCADPWECLETHRTSLPRMSGELVTAYRAKCARVSAGVRWWPRRALPTSRLTTTPWSRTVLSVPAALRLRSAIGAARIGRVRIGRARIGVAERAADWSRPSVSDLSG